MNYYGQQYTDSGIDYITVVEGVYYKGAVAKARVIGMLNLTERKMIKYVKQPYNVLDLSEGVITLKKYRVDLATHIVYYDDKFTLLQEILGSLGQAAESITHIIESIDRISADKRIKPHTYCYTAEYISL
jgi:hypothetical protein